MLKRKGKNIGWNRWPKAVISLVAMILLAVQIVGDFTGDASNGNNVRIARYWGKNSIRVDYRQ